MATKTARVVLRGRFPKGTKVELRERRSDNFSGHEKIVARAKVNNDREAVFRGLGEGDRFWVSAEVDGEVRAVMVTAKCAPARKERRERPNTFEARPAQRERGPHTDRPKKAPAELVGNVHQRDVPAHVLQSSATPLGHATPKDPNEFANGLPQSEVPDDVVQTSSTPHGHAAVKVEEVSQAEASGLQRSDMPEGEAKPKPSDEALARLGRREPPKVKGKSVQPPKPKPATRPKPASKPKPKAKAKGRTAAQRSASAKKAAATRKRNAAKKG